MKFKQLYPTNNYRSDKNIPHGKNGSSRSGGTSSIITETNKLTDNQFIRQLQDLEERNVYLENLVEQQTAKLTEVVETNSRFISIIAHDLRSPFTSILAALEILKLHLNDYDINEIELDINLVYNSANRTLNLLDNLLTWTISQNREKSFNPVRINLYELYVNEIESVQILAGQKQITLNCSISPDLNVAADLQMIKTVLRNLIGNAIKYTPAGGEIKISAMENIPYVEIAIRDNGTGISSEVQKNLFKIDAFHSKDGTNHEKGTGLGLLICKEFVEMHGGNIRIESKLGEGSEFKFTLPHYI
jgi:signal transduction histidine kinase